MLSYSRFAPPAIAVSASMSATSSWYVGWEIQYAELATTPTTAMKTATSPAICPADSVDASLRRCVKSWSMFTIGQRRLDGHPHDVLVGLDDLVANLNSELQCRVGFLQRDHGLVHIAAAVEHAADGLVGVACRGLDGVDGILERVAKPG